MTEEKLWEAWEALKGTYSFSTTPDGDDFLRTGLNPHRTLTQCAQRCYGGYPDILTAELDGPNAILAGRMLRVMGQARSQGMISQYGWELDTEICCRIGYTFGEVLKGGYLRYNSIYNGKYTWDLAELLIRFFPGESGAFADQLLGSGAAGQKNIDKLLENRNRDRSVYLMADVACQFLLLDGARYGRYLPAVEAVASAVDNEYVTMPLYCGRGLSDALLQRLKTLILESLDFTRSLIRSCLERRDLKALIKELGLPVYPYYLFSVTVCDYQLSQAQRAASMRELYRTDRETFLEVYKRLSRLPNPQDAVYSLGLLAILLQNGEGRQELEAARLRLLSYPGLLKSYFSSGANIVRDCLMDKDSSPADIAARGLLSFMNRYLQYGDSQVLLTIYAALYDDSPVAKKLFWILLETARFQNDSGNLATLYGFFLAGRQAWLEIPMEESAGLLIADGFTRRECFQSYCVNAAESDCQRIGFSDVSTAALVRGHEDEAMAFLKAADGPAAGRVAWISLLYDLCGFTDYGLLVDLLKDKSKLVRKRCEELLASREEGVRPLLEERSPKWKGEAAQSARRLLKRWDNERKFGRDFVLADNGMMAEFCQDNYNAENEKAISWIPEDMLLDIRYADLSAKAPAIVAKFILVEYMSLTDPYRVKSCDKVVQRLHPQDFQAALENIYRLWLDDGADTRKKAVLIPYCVYASDPQIIRLRRQIEQWAENARGALGAYAVNAVALNGGSVALMMVDSMAAKFPHNQVKKAAKAAFAYAARALELPEDELSDRIVPDLGFGRTGEKTVDYGSRTFTVSLLPDFSLSIFDDAKGKAVKSLPKPGAEDDPVKAEAAKKEFSELKKQIRAVVQTQAARLERVLMDGRRWTVSRWNALFVENAIMHRFATGLIWGVYEGDTLQTAFRYMDDGTFNTVDEEEFELPANAEITLVHPVDLNAETLEAWRQQLEDYEVTQPIEQLSRPAPLPAEQELDENCITRYRGRTVTAGKLSGAAKKYSMARGEVLDGGSYTCFHLVDKYLNLAAQINFEFMYMGMEYSEMVPLETLLFYRLHEDGSVNDEPQPNVILDPKKVPARFVSSVMAILDAML